MSQEHLRSKGHHLIFIQDNQQAHVKNQQGQANTVTQAQLVTHHNQYQQTVTSQNPTVRCDQPNA